MNTTPLLKSSIAREQNKKLREEFNGTKALAEKGQQMAKQIVKLESEVQYLKIMLAQACDEQEGIFDSTGELASPAIGVQYVTWARYLEKYGRTPNRAYEVQEWINH